MRAAAAAERLHRPSGTAMRRSGVMRGSEAPLTKGSSRAWDPDRAAREAGERASRSGLRPNANGSGKRCEHPEEAYADMRYRSADKVCPGECADRLGCKLTLLPTLRLHLLTSLSLCSLQGPCHAQGSGARTGASART